MTTGMEKPLLQKTDYDKSFTFKEEFYQPILGSRQKFYLTQNICLKNTYFLPLIVKTL